MATAESAVRPDSPPTTEHVTPGTWLRFLVGGREAILQIGRSPQALWLGLLFVLSTGFAREYDGADLRSEPWHLALPLVASLGTSLILWTLVYLGAVGRGLKYIGFWAGYRTLLTFYWLMAPMAWLYAIPVERFMSPVDAMAANLWLLAGVSAWRVLLITRAISVWLSASFVVVFFLVMFFADSVAVALAYVAPAPIFNVMGGVRMSDPDQLRASATFLVMTLGILSWPAWALIAEFVYAVAKNPWTLLAVPDASVRVSKSLWGLGCVLLVAGVSILPFGQPEQIHAHEASKLFGANDVPGAVSYMANLPRDAFPPVWDPPPRIGYREERPDVINVLAEIERQKAPGWIAELYIDKIAIVPGSVLSGASPEDVERVLSILETKIPVENLSYGEWYRVSEIARDPSVKPEHSKRLRDYLGDHYIE
jgi:hypothetical protein